MQTLIPFPTLPNIAAECLKLAHTNPSRPAGPKEVIVTGTFDNWGKTLPLVKQVDGSYELTVPLLANETILYKYVVDGEWLVNQSQHVTRDGSGIENNSLEANDLVAASSTQSKIPEAGGLSVADQATATAAATAATDGSQSSDLKTTVMPSTEGQQTTLGEPGIFVPKDPEALAAFETVRNVDPKTLNEPEEVTPVLSAEEKKKQKKKLKRTQYKARKKQQKANGTSSSEVSPEPETLDPAVVGAIGAGGLAGATGAGLAATQAHNAPETAPEASEAVPEVSEAVPVTSEPVPAATEPLPTTESVSETAPVVAESAPLVTEEVPAAPVETPVVKDVEPTIEPAINEPIENGELETSVVADEVHETPVAAEPIEETAPVASPIETAPVIAQADEVEAKEVDAAPVTKGKASYDSDDEIIIAQGGLSKEIEAQLKASDINAEEIQPTASEAKRLAEEANIDPAEAKPASKSAAAAKPAAKTSKSTKKDEKKKKSGFISKLKKLFK